MDSTLLKGLVVLDLAVSADGPVSVSQLARELSLPKSSVHRSLSTLREAGYLLFNEEDRRYYPSLKIAQMGLTVSTHFPYRQAVLPYLERLTAECSETAHFAFLDGATSVFIASALPKAKMASVIPDNYALPWHRTAFGIAAVSALPQAQATRLLSETGASETSRKAVSAARDTGYAFLPQIEDRGTFELAMPIRTSWKTLIGTIGISGPASRLVKEQISDLVEALTRVAADTFSEARTIARQPASRTK